jgi:hypothetical protein
MVPDRLARLEAKLQALEEISAIKRLKYRYLRACDRKQPEELRDCLSPNSAVIAYEGFPQFNDRDSFVEVFRQMACRPNIIDMHHGENPIITITSPNTAIGTWDLFFHSIDTDAGTMLQMACEYSDEYARLDGRWWISRTATRRRSYLLQTIGKDGVPRVSVLGTPPDAPYGDTA